MARLNDRISRLEARIPPPKDEAAEVRPEITIAILNEFARLKQSGAPHYRGPPRGPIPIPPEDIPLKVLRPGYTPGQLWELAIRNVVSRIREDQPDLFDVEGRKDLLANWTQSFNESFEAQFGDDERVGWDKVEDAPYP